jgi:hypothetical protein
VKIFSVFFCTFDIISDQLFCQKDGAMIGSKRAMSFADKTAELWFEIDQLHLSFLQHDETPPKVISRRHFCVSGSGIFAGL